MTNQQYSDFLDSILNAIANPEWVNGCIEEIYFHFQNGGISRDELEFFCFLIK